MVDAIRFLVDSGIKWRAMPVDLPAWDRVYALFRRRRDKGLVKEFHERLRGKAREAADRDPEPTAGSIDAQSVKAAASVPASSRGFDGGKKINDRKRHIVVDTTGLLLTVMVTAANVTDRERGQVLLARLAERFFLLRLVWADGGYTTPLADFAAKMLRLALTVAQRDADASGFVVLPQVGGGADVRVTDAFAPSGPRLRKAGRHVRGDGAVVDDHGHEPPPCEAATLKEPGVFSTSKPRAGQALRLGPHPFDLRRDQFEVQRVSELPADRRPFAGPRSAKTCMIRW
ncbi:transposase [Streptomyces sp. NPDC048430]|uniref:transposase n=1 Tax=Streptomyces sp. NPDC048430 TaxID=3155388 RepID=UPI003425D947